MSEIIVTADIPREVSDILVDIKYIAGIPPGKKFDIAARTYVSATAWGSRVYRTFVNEDREGALTFISNTLTKAIAVCKRFPDWKELITKDVSLVSNTLINLRHVYSGDPDAIAKIDTATLRVDPAAFRRACSKESDA